MSIKAELIDGMRNGTIVPFLGPGVLKGVVNRLDQAQIPADSDSLIYALTGGQPMSPRLMYEFPRAAMHLENKKGRKFIEQSLYKIYAENQWSESVFHRWLCDLYCPYIIDSNRDLQLQTLYAERAHFLIVGVARIAAHPYRFDIYRFENGSYHEIAPEQLDTRLPILFKPLGSPEPKLSFVASDADFVDYITELMGGFAVPEPIKNLRKGKQYLFFGTRFTRDTERMVMSDLIYDANEGRAGWAFIAEPNDKERRYLDKKNIELIEQDWCSLIGEQSLEVA